MHAIRPGPPGSPGLGRPAHKRPAMTVPASREGASRLNPTYDVVGRGLISRMVARPAPSVPDEIDADEPAQAGDRIDRRFELRQGVAAGCGQRAPTILKPALADRHPLDSHADQPALAPLADEETGAHRRSRNERLEQRDRHLPRTVRQAHGRRPGKTYPPSRRRRPASGRPDTGRRAASRRRGRSIRVGGVSIESSRSRAARRALSAASSTASAVEPSSRAPAWSKSRVRLARIPLVSGAISTVKSAASRSSRTRPGSSPAAIARSSRGRGRRARRAVGGHDDSNRSTWQAGEVGRDRSAHGATLGRPRGRQVASRRARPP